jgi:hypothetical protein
MGTGVMWETKVAEKSKGERRKRERSIERTKEQKSGVREMNEMVQ